MTIMSFRPIAKPKLKPPRTLEKGVPNNNTIERFKMASTKKLFPDLPKSTISDGALDWNSENSRNSGQQSI